jgi:glutathione peroxidase
MKQALIIILVLSLFSIAACSGGDEKGSTMDTPTTDQSKTNPTAGDVRRMPLETITGDTAHLADYTGKVVLIVNVASECGFTGQYAGLEELYRAYQDRGLVVLGFPANNFGGQEPGTNEQIQKFCESKFGVTFPMMAKVSVKGADKHPLFVHLTEQEGMTGEIKWNFSKFLLDRDGNLAARFGSTVKPMSKKLVRNIEQLL